MTISDLKDLLKREKNFGSRFPARIIFAENLAAYLELVNQLQGICDRTINIAEFCAAADTVPKFHHVSNWLKSCAGKQILLLSVGEYLRLCTKRELDGERCQFKAFWEIQQPKYSLTRVIMPMFSCRELFDRIIGAVDERQQNYIWTIDTPRTAESYAVTIFSPNFKTAIQADAANLCDWLLNWSELLKRKSACSIVTNLYANVETTYGMMNIKSVGSPFRYLVNALTDGDKLKEDWLDNDDLSQIVTLVAKLPAKISFAKFVTAALNVNEFDFVTVAARWRILTACQKNLVWLWYRVYPAVDYFSYACRKAETADDIPNKIRDELLLMPDRSDAWIAERTAALKVLNFTSYDAAYFALLDKLPLPETKLKLLTYQTHEEKTFAVKIISELLRGGAEVNAIVELIKNSYPDLAIYLRDDGDSEVDKYMAWYRKNKLINRFCGACPITVRLEQFDARYKVMQKSAAENYFQFWIDGFGAEYFSLFLLKLSLHDIDVSVSTMALALLPTDTHHNHQWSEDALKWNRLDKLSHGGIPDDKSYYSCIVSQLEFFDEVADKVADLLKKYNGVVITGDHGSSRLAALAFHDDNVAPLTVPKNSVVRNFGRYCELAEDVDAMPETVKVTSPIDGKIYLAMNNYHHFSAHGNAAGGNTDDNDVVGEIHGGNTPEERLVPVIVVKRRGS